MKTSFIIVADRGTLRAYGVVEAAGRGRMPRLLEENRIDEARGRWQDKVTDQAGAFPSGVRGATAERMTAEAENETRSLRHVAERVIALLRKHQPARWSFAAPSEINSAILDGLPAAEKQRLAQNLPLDLTKVPADELLAHFDRA